MKRIAIIGCAGSGKTMLALRLGKLLNLTVYHLDQYYWKPNWQKVDFDRFLRMHDELCDKPEWIIEGIHSRALPYRLERADAIIFLDIPRYKCLWNVIKRTIQYYGTVRPTSPAGCPERFSIAYLKFLHWIWNFEKRTKKVVLDWLEYYKNDKAIFHVKSFDEIDRVLTELTK